MTQNGIVTQSGSPLATLHSPLIYMLPIICQIGPFTLYSYGMSLVAGFLLAVFLAQRHAKRFDLDPVFVFNFAFWVFISGIIGARIFFIVDHLHYYMKNPVEIVMLQHGGLSFFGGLFGGFFGGGLCARRAQVKLYKILDFFVPFVALAQSLGRIGCFFNGCCYGRESAYGLYSPLQDSHLIPTQLYSSFFLLIIFIILRLLQERPHKLGGIFYMYLILYALKRFCIEFFRADNPPLIGNLTIFHILSIAVFIISAVQLIIIKVRRS